MDNETTLESPSLRDQLESAIDTVEATPEVVEAEVSDKPRDESGKFKSNKEVTETPSEVQEEVIAETITAKPRPSSWKKDYE